MNEIDPEQEQREEAIEVDVERLEPDGSGGQETSLGRALGPLDETFAQALWRGSASGAQDHGRCRRETSQVH